MILKVFIYYTAVVFDVLFNSILAQSGFSALL